MHLNGDWSWKTPVPIHRNNKDGLQRENSLNIIKKQTTFVFHKTRGHAGLKRINNGNRYL